MRTIAVAVALVLPVVGLAVLAEERGETGVATVLFLAAIGTLVALQVFGSRR
jgi:hypothetical protein